MQYSIVLCNTTNHAFIYTPVISLVDPTTANPRSDRADGAVLSVRDASSEIIPKGVGEIRKI